MTPPASDHFNGKTFFQPGAHPERTFRDFLRWRFSSRPPRWPARVELPAQPFPPVPHGGEIVLTWLGHATFLVQTRSANVLLDPVFSERVSPFAWIGPRRVHPPPIALEALPEIHVVCLSHDHYDHFDAASLRRLAARYAPLFVAPLRHGDLLAHEGARRIVELDWWQTHRIDEHATVMLTPTKHWSNRLGTPRNHRLWGGFDLSFGDGDRTRKVWFAGDSGYDEHLFREIRARCGAPDAALLPIGAYEPRWFMAPMHLNPAEAVRLHRDMGAKLSLAMHWGTFQLTDEPRDEPPRALAQALQEQGVPAASFRVLLPGESVTID